MYNRVTKNKVKLKNEQNKIILSAKRVLRGRKIVIKKKFNNELKSKFAKGLAVFSTEGYLKPESWPEIDLTNVQHFFISLIKLLSLPTNPI